MEKKILKSLIILLTILDLLISVTGFYFLFHKEWLLGIFLFIVSSITFNNTFKIKQASSLLTTPKDPKNESAADVILRGLSQSATLLILPAIVMLFHFDFRWYLAIPLGLLIGPAIAFSLFGISKLISFL
jgi:hypothetical protein